MMIEIELKTGSRFTHVPYKGGAEWMQALLAGQIDFIADASQWGPFVDDGRARVLAMVSEARLPKSPSVPTLREVGVDAVGQSPYGLVDPKGLPPQIVQALCEAFRAADHDPATLELLGRSVQAPWNATPANTAPSPRATTSASSRCWSRRAWPRAEVRGGPRRAVSRPPRGCTRFAGAVAVAARVDCGSTCTPRPSPRRRAEIGACRYRTRTAPRSRHSPSSTVAACNCLADNAA